MIVLDTSVLSLAFRRSGRRGPPDPVQSAVTQLIAQDWPVALPGIVYQELLSGVRTRAERRRLARTLSGFTTLIAQLTDHQLAAEISNACRAGGVAASAVDCLIAAQTISRGARLFTTDRDFDLIVEHSDLRLLRAEDLEGSGQRGDEHETSDEP